MRSSTMNSTEKEGKDDCGHWDENIVVCLEIASGFALMELI